MVINEILKEKKMSRYKLSKLSGVPQTTIFDICNGKTKLEKCEVGTLLKIAKVLGTTIDVLLSMEEDGNKKNEEYRSSFENFKSEICHCLKEIGDASFVKDTIESNKIRELFDKKWYLESLYLLGMVDYVSRINKLPLDHEYDDIREHKLTQIVYPTGVLLMAKATGDEKIKDEALKNAIPELLRFNIVESEVKNIV